MNEQADRYPWYDVVQGDTLEQGDILLELDVVLPVERPAIDAQNMNVEVQTANVIIMTQSCDLEQDKVRSVLLCPVSELWGFVDDAKKRGSNWGTDIREKLRQGMLPGYHLLNEFAQEEVVFPLSVVDFHEVYAAPTAQVREFAAKESHRLRLCPPYKEHLAQSFARFFMRVGLPVSIPKEKLKEKPQSRFPLRRPPIE